MFTEQAVVIQLYLVQGQSTSCAFFRHIKLHRFRTSRHSILTTTRKLSKALMWCFTPRVTLRMKFSMYSETSVSDYFYLHEVKSPNLKRMHCFVKHSTVSFILFNDPYICRMMTTCYFVQIGRSARVGNLCAISNRKQLFKIIHLKDVIMTFQL